MKDVSRLRAAYDDAAGLTAEFNRNALHVVNHELGADFEPDRFEHVARWDGAAQWMDIRLRSTVAQRVHVAALGLDVDFAAGEEMRTEISAKFTVSGLEREMEDAGFVIEKTRQAGVDDFLLVLARPYC